MTHGDNFGWFGRGVTIAQVPSIVVALGGLAVALALLLAGRTSSTARGPRTWRQLGVVALTATGLATVLRHLPILSAPNLVAVAVAVVAVGSFFISRFWRENAPCDEWLPALFMGIAIASAGVHYPGDSLALQLTTHVSLLLTIMIATTMSLGLLAVFRRPATWRATAGLALQGPLLLVVQYGHHPHRPVWTVVLVALGTAALYGTLVSFSRPEHRWVSRGAAVVALFFLGGQLIEQGSQGNYFTVNLIALIALATLAVARRHQPLISTPVLLGSAVVAGLTWGRWDDYTNHLGYWLVGGSLVLLAALHDVDQEDSYTTLAPGLLFGFTAGVLQLVQLANGSSPTTRIVLVALATVVTVGGFIARRDAAIEIGAVASAIGLTVYVPGETAWSVTAVALSVIATLMGTQQRRPSLRVTERSAKLTGGVAVIRVGAPSEAESKQLKEAFEDAISATKAAIAEAEKQAAKKR